MYYSLLYCVCGSLKMILEVLPVRQEMSKEKMILEIIPRNTLILY